MDDCCTFEPSLGKVKILCTVERQQGSLDRRRRTNRRLLPMIPMRPSGHSSAEKLQAWSSVSKMRGVNWRMFWWE
jgi:hypothetical protein